MARPGFRWAFVLLPGLLALAGGGAADARAAARRTFHFSVASTQRFHVGDAATAAAAMTFKCGGGFIADNAGATNEIRVQIPASVAMEWNTALTTPTLSVTRYSGTGSVSGSVSGTVSYTGTKILNINVLTSFIDGTGIDQLVVTGLQFRNFTAPTSAAAGFPTLEVSFFSGAFVAEINGRTVAIASPPAVFSSDASQTFFLGTSANIVSPITVTEAADGPGANILPGLWNSTNLRIRIPNGLALEWDALAVPAVTWLSAGGSKVGAVSYLNIFDPIFGLSLQKIAVIDVTSDFVEGDSFQVSNLRVNVSPAASVSGPSSLALSINANSAVTAATDDKTKETRGVPTIVSAADQQFSKGDPASAAGAIDLQDAPGVATFTAANDIRISIPALFPMEWNQAAAPGFVVGAGVGTLSAPAFTFLSAKVLRINVATTFSPSQTLQVNGLQFMNFTAAGQNARLELEVDADPAPENLDTRRRDIGAPVLSSFADQVFQVVPPGPVLDLMEPVTITDDGFTPRIKVANSVRVRIPAGFNMTWDDPGGAGEIATVAWLSGGGTKIGAGGTVAVTFADAGRTLVIPVGADFVAGDSFRISGLNFTGFAAPSNPGNLELIVNGGLNTVTDTDDKLIAIGGLPSVSSAASQFFSVNDPATAMSPITVTDAPGFPTITSANNIRITIPSAVDMAWSDPGAAGELATVNWLSGGASKVGPNVTFTDAGKTLVIDATSDFLANDSFQISGLSFQSFGSASAAGAHRLELRVSGSTVADTDSQTLGIGRPTITSLADQTFGVGDPATPVSLITVTDDPNFPRLKAAADIRIRIPAGFGMTWDSSDTQATFGGSALTNGRVTNGPGNVSYEDANQTLVVQVDVDFAAGEVLTIDGLSFGPFTAVSAPDNLELEVNNLNTVVNLDPMTIEITDRPVITGATTRDADGNGSIDRIIIVFSEDIQLLGLAAFADGFSVAGYATGLAVEGPAGTLALFIGETGYPDTGVTPLLSYDPALGGIADLQGLEPTFQGPTPAGDGAPPRVMGSSRADTDGDGFLNTVTFTFSEPLLPGGGDLSDWTLVDADGFTNLLLGLGDANVVISGNTVTLTLADSAGTAGPPIYRYQEDGFGGTLLDASGNSLPTSTNNTKPVASAGLDQTVPPSTYTLDGSGSSDPDGQPIAYLWTQTGGPAAVTLTNGTTASPSFFAVTPGAYTFRLAVSDGLEVSTDTVVITIYNLPPTADAGPDQAADFGAFVTMDGIASVDSNGAPLASLVWTQVGGPTVILNPSSPTAVTFDTFDLIGVANNGAVLEFQLTVTDAGGATDTDNVFVQVQGISGNRPPAADAGADRTAVAGTLLTLDGRLSSDPDGGPLTYQWEPSALLSGASTATPSFTPTVPGVYGFSLVVTDPAGVASAPDSVTVLVVAAGNGAPVAAPAVASPAGEVVAGTVVTLDGSASFDPDGTPVSYAWIQAGGPAVILDNPDGANPSFTAPVPGTYVFSLIPASGGQVGLPVQVTVQVVSTSGDPLPDAVAVLDPADDGLPADGRVLDSVGFVDLLGSASTGTGLTFRWEQVSGPRVQLYATSASDVGFFTVPVAGLYVFELTVIDASGLRDTAAVSVVVDVAGGNQAPVANAGADLSGSRGVAVTLDGSASADDPADPDGVTGPGTGLLAFWEQVSGPAAALSDPASFTPSFIPAAGGTYVFALSVSDGAAQSAADLVTVTVSGVGPPVGSDDSSGCGLTGLEAFLGLALIVAAGSRRRRA